MITYRKARLSDAEDIITLINSYAEKGLMLPRTRNTLYEGIREFIIAQDNGVLIGTGALHVLWEDLCEIRALAVSEEYLGKGVGRALVELLCADAIELGCPKVFSLTYQVGFFKHMGFQMIDKENLPHKVWKECINCVKFPNCDENAMVLTVS